MEPESLPPASAVVICENCKASNSADLKFCPNCSFPIGGSEHDKYQFRLKVSNNKRLIKNAKEKIQSAKTIMYVLAGLTFVVGLYAGLGEDNYEGLMINLILSVLYLIMVAWADKNPFAAILTAFIIYITINLLNAFFEPATLFQGIILKIIFIGGFIKGIKSAQEAQESLKELERIKAAPLS